MVVPVAKRLNKAQTWPLILGIIFVVCLDVAFTTYMAADFSGDIALNAVSINDSFEVTPGPAPDMDVTSESMQADLNAASDEPETASPAKPRTSYASERRRAASRPDFDGPRRAKNFVVTTPPNWQPRIITYRASEPVAFQTRPEPAVTTTYPAVARYVPRPNVDRVSEARIKRREKNPFMAVIKKPWQLMKAIASKFN